MMEVSILLVENEQVQRQLFNDSVDVYNKKNNTQIQVDEAGNLEEGLNKIRQSNYDAAIVDLRLADNDQEGQGNQILREIKERLRLPVRVISGHLGDLDPALKEDTILFKCISRGDQDNEKIISEICDIKSTGITKILNNEGLIEHSIGQVFWTHLAPVIPTIIDDLKKNNKWNPEKMLLRYVSSHLMEYLELNDNSTFEAMHRLEFYIKPIIRKTVFTGDIIRSKTDGSYWIVITPSCDLATDEFRAIPKAKHIALLYIESLESIFKNKNRNDQNNLTRNSLDLKYHFLPETEIFQGGFINFQMITSVEIEKISDPQQYEPMCSVTSSFRKDIVSRFSIYYSRQGQPSVSG